jgi:hypothetical protein
MASGSVMNDTGYGLYINGTHNVIREHCPAKVLLQGMLINAMIRVHLAAVVLYTTMKSAQNHC